MNRFSALATFFTLTAATASADIILVQAQGVQDPSLHPGFWGVANDSALDLVRVELDLPGGGRQFDSGFGGSVDNVSGASIADISFSFPGDNGDNLRIDFAPGSFRNGAIVSFYADVDNWVFAAADMVGIAVSLTFADGSTMNDVFQNVDNDPFYDFGPSGSGAAFVPAPMSIMALAAAGGFASMRRRR